MFFTLFASNLNTKICNYFCLIVRVWIKTYSLILNQIKMEYKCSILCMIHIFFPVLYHFDSLFILELGFRKIEYNVRFTAN